MNQPKESPAQAGHDSVVLCGSDHNTTSKENLDIAAIKARVDPLDFYRSHNGTMPATRKQSGWVLGGLCPFHADQRVGSFKVNLDTGAFHCFSCGASGGDVIDFLMQRDSIDFLAAVKELAPDVDLPTTRDGRPRLSLRDAFNALVFESTVVTAAAGALARGEHLDDKELRRLRVAWRRLMAVKEVV